MSPSPVRVLVVDDYEPFRRFVCSTLDKIPQLQVIGEASDGLEAIDKAEELQPDLIVLDIGLPKLNGIESARRIRMLCPESRIIFLSLESSADVVLEALRSGALGYVVKTFGGSELLAAVEAVLQGRQFVSRGLSGDSFADATDWQASPDEALPSPAPQKARITRNHQVQFSSDDASLLSGFTRFIEAVLRAGNVAIVIATEANRNRLFERLQAQGLNIGAAIQQGSYIPLDVADILSTFMVNDLPDPVGFHKVTGDLLGAAAKAAKGKRPRVAACGECASILWTQGKADAAIQLEHLWDEVARTYDVDILCGYRLASFQGGAGSYIFERICAEHSTVYSQ